MIVCNCGHNRRHRISLTKLSPSSNEGFARSRASRSASRLQTSLLGWGSRGVETFVVRPEDEIDRDRRRGQEKQRYRKLGQRVHTIVPALATSARVCKASQ